MIDLHCHVLPGIDDGPDTIAESLALVRAAGAAGVQTIVATPHASARYPNRADEIARLTVELGTRLRTEGVEVDVLAGAEIALSHLEQIEPEELRRMRLGDGPWLLLEPPFVPVVVGIDRAVARLQSEGHSVLLAHPERCPAFHRDPRLLGALVRDGALTSITAGSLVGRFGKTVRRFTDRLLSEGLVHNVASDAHSRHRRPPGMAAELEQAGLGALSDWLTVQVPRAILGGEEVPRRPRSAARSRSGWRGLLRRR